MVTDRQIKLRVYVVLLVLGSLASARGERYHLKLDTVLGMDRWYSGYEYVVEKADINHRLRLHIFEGELGNESIHSNIDIAEYYQ